MIRILFLIHDLGQGGAEKVLVELVGHMDPARFDVTVLALFGGGVNEPFLSPRVRLLHGHPRAFPGNSRVMKLSSPERLFRRYVKEKYDVIVSYLEGPSARIVSGCPRDGTKLVSWIHVEQHTMTKAAAAFRSPKEARRCYGRFDRTICVARTVAEDFQGIFSLERPPEVLYNTVDSEKILALAEEPAPELTQDGAVRLAAVGSLKESKGYDRLLRTVERIRGEGQAVHLYILGMGPLEQQIRGFVRDHGLEGAVTLLGYQTNPYRYVAKCDLFVCPSFAEGFSTAATEALIVGTPVLTTRVSGMEEMLGDGEYGVIVDNDEEALYQGLRDMLTAPGKLEHYRQKARERGAFFSTEKTVRAVEEMLESL